MTNRVVGTCGSCGGDVVLIDPQWSVKPMPPKCEGCGKAPKQAKPPVLEMEDAKSVDWVNRECSR